MPGTGFGFPAYPQRPSVSPQAVGQMLQQQQPPTEMLAAPMAPVVDPQAVGRSLSDSGMDDTPIGGASNLPSAVNILAQETTARGAAATQGTQRTPASPATLMQLQRMGVSAEEIQLLIMNGSIA